MRVLGDLKKSFCVLLVATLLLFPLSHVLHAYEVPKELPEPYRGIVQQAVDENAQLALIEINQKIKERPYDAMAYFVRGLITLYKIGDARQAIIDIHKCGELSGTLNKEYLNPGSIPVMSHLFKGHFLLGEYDRAQQYAEDMIYIAHQYDPAKYQELYALLGQCQIAKAEYRQAKKSFQKALEALPDDDEVLLEMGYCWHNLGYQKDAASYFERVTVTAELLDYEFLSKPISLKTKALISDIILVLQDYVYVPSDMVKTAQRCRDEYVQHSKHRKLVKQVQQCLDELGYVPGSADGVMGPKTRQALQSFQREHKLKPDGQATKSVYAELQQAIAQRQRPKPQPPAEIPVAPPVIQIQNTVVETAPTFFTIPQLVPRITPIVVKIVIKNWLGEKKGLGSGFFVAPDLVATNYHVIEKGLTCEVITSDGMIYKKTDVVAVDEQLDLAIIQVNKIFHEHIVLAADILVTIGEQVVVFGNPLGLEYSISDGIVSALRGKKGKMEMLQITAPISPGSSGGPVVNMQGEVVGISTESLPEGQNLNFAVSSKHLLPLIDRAKKRSH